MRARPFCLSISLLLMACAPAPPPVRKAQADPAAEAWYGQAVDELAAMNRRAADLFQKGKSDEAAAIILKGEPIAKRLLAVARPTLAATEAASDLDELYGRMLFSNRNYGWARLMFQKNLARWKYWKPRTPDTEKRQKRAESLIAECDRSIGQ